MSRPPLPHSLKIRCPTWDHVEGFYQKKVKEDGSLGARVPFSPRLGDVITLALELPDELVIAIDARIDEVAPAGDGVKSAVRMVLVGLNAAVRGRLEALVAESRKHATAPAPLPRPKNFSRPPAPQDEPPVPLPTDAPVDEIIEPPHMPTAAEVSEFERHVFVGLERQLGTMREAAAHEVLGVRWDGSVEEIRTGYLGLVARLHPDRFARYRSPPIQLLASELFIYVNKAYDRMRDAAVAAGNAIVAGPALLPHRGWMAGFEDLGTPRPAEAPAPAKVAPAPAKVAPAPAQAPPVQPAAAPLAAADTKTRVTFGRPTPAGGNPIVPASAGATTPAPRPGAATPRPATPAPAPRPPTAPAAGATAPAPAIKPPAPPASALDGLNAESLFDEVAEADGGTAMPLIDTVTSEVGRAATLVQEARADHAAGNYPSARDRLVEALRLTPRDRRARALFHVVQGLILAGEGKVVEGTTQLEAALAHDPASAEAKAALAQLKQDGKRSGLFKRLFK